MSVSRRRFLKHGAFAAIACAAVPAHALTGRKHDVDGSGDLGRNPFSHPTLSVSRSTFESLVGSPFKVTPTSGNGSPVWLRLVSVQDLPPVVPVNPGLMSVAPPRIPSVPATTGYILSFSAGGTSLTQDTYIFENAQMGKFPMFIVPAGPGEYTALFNLLVAPLPLAPSDDHPSPVHSEGPGGAASPPGSAGAASGGTQVPAGNAGVGSFGGAEATSPGGRPAQEQLEPMLGRGVKTQMPE